VFSTLVKAKAFSRYRGDRENPVAEGWHALRSTQPILDAVQQPQTTERYREQKMQTLLSANESAVAPVSTSPKVKAMSGQSIILVFVFSWDGNPIVEPD